MRIPSGLNDGNLYRRRDQKSPEPAAYRRLLRLILALVLILVVMQQAGKPGVYKIFFSQPAQSKPATPLRPRATVKLDMRPAEPGDSAFSQVQADLENADLNQVADAALWTKADAPAFYRLLEGTPLQRFRDLSPRRVSAISLLQQPAVYLRTQVTMAATVARISERQALSNDFAITRYWELWLQPQDGSNRPVAFYTHEVPVAIAQLVGTDYLPDGPAIEIEGVYLKRLVYRSTAGNELAPAIIGQIRSSDSLPAVATTTATAAAAASRPSLLVLTTVAAVLGIAAFSVIAMATTLSSRRLRRTRLAHQQASPQLFAALASELESNEQSSS